MFDDKLFEYLVATDQIDEVLGFEEKEKSRRNEKEVFSHKKDNNKENNEVTKKDDKKNQKNK